MPLSAMLAPVAPLLCADVVLHKEEFDRNAGFAEKVVAADKPAFPSTEPDWRKRAGALCAARRTQPGADAMALSQQLGTRCTTRHRTPQTRALPAVPPFTGTASEAAALAECHGASSDWRRSFDLVRSVATRASRTPGREFETALAFCLGVAGNLCAVSLEAASGFVLETYHESFLAVLAQFRHATSVAVAATDAISSALWVPANCKELARRRGLYLELRAMLSRNRNDVRAAGSVVRCFAGLARAGPESIARIVALEVVEDICETFADLEARQDGPACACVMEFFAEVLVYEDATEKLITADGLDWILFVMNYHTSPNPQNREVTSWGLRVLGRVLEGDTELKRELRGRAPNVDYFIHDYNGERGGPEEPAFVRVAETVSKKLAARD